MRKNKILQRSISVLLTLTLILSGLFTAPKANAQTQMQEVTIHHMRLDTAVVFAWSDGRSGWQKGIAQGGQYDTQYLIDIGKDMKNVKVKNYDEVNFPFDWSKDTNTFKQHFNETPVCKNKKDYENNYKPYFARINSVGGANSYSPGSGKLYVEYDVLLSTPNGKDYDVKAQLNEGKQQEILDLLGDNVPADITKSMNLFSTQAAQIDPKVKGFLYFIPIIIEYDETKMVEVVPDPEEPEPLILEATLGLPNEAKQGEAYTVTDETKLPKDAVFEKSTLQKHYGDNAWKAVSGWDGSKLGGSISQSERDIGKVFYQITVTLKSGEKDDDSKSINIIDATVVDGKVKLVLDEYTYEGHPADAFDYSAFTINGTLYTAARAYDEKMASNRFRVVEDTQSKVNQKTSTGAEITFAKKGFYHVKLEVSPKNGSKLTDVQPIEVRKTPYIVAGIGGRQKENRKQTLTASVAIYPDQPITKVNITLKDKKTGETATYTMQEHQITGYIKSRALRETKEEYFTNYCLEFLTKYKDTREMEYTISVTDKKGDRDETSGSFTVEPDLPPAPVIDMQTDYYRNQGSNLAHITAEDATISSDGDDIIRYWQAAIDQNHDGSFTEPYQPLSELNGKNLSFGTNKKVQFDKTGVGKVDVKLFVKDKWNEETLEEFITDADDKKADITKQTQVNNIAPTVRLEPIKTKTAEITILTGGSAENEEIRDSLNKLKQEFLAEGIDAHINVEPLPTPVDGGRPVPTKYETVKYNYESQWSFLEENNFSVDSKRVYKVEGSYPFATSSKSADNELMQPICIYACDAGNGLPLWMFTLSESILKISDFSSNNLELYHDDTDTYLYIVTSGKTILLDKKTGALVTILNTELGESNFVTDQYIFTFAKDGIYTIDRSNATMKKVRAFTGGSAKRIAGKVYFLEVNIRTCYKGSLDLNSQQVKLEKLPGNEKDSWDETYELVGFDNLGKTAVVGKKQGVVRVYDGSNRLIKTITAQMDDNYYTFGVPVAVYDENGNFNYISHTRTGSGSKWRYVYLDVWGVNSDFYASQTQSKTGDFPPSTDRTIYAKQHGHKLCIVTGAENWYVWGLGSSYYDSLAFLWEVNTVSGQIQKGGMGSIGMHSMYEYGMSSDNFFVANCNLGTPDVGNWAESRTTALPQQMYEILYKKVSKYANPQKQIKMTIIYDDTSPDSYYWDSFEAAANRIKKEDGRLVFIRSQGEQTHIKEFIDASGGQLIGKDGKTIESVIKETVMAAKEETQSVLKVAGSGTMQRELALDPLKTYFYEYDIKDSNQTAPPKDVFRMKLNEEKALPESDFSGSTYYPTDIIQEDFSSAKVNPFFTLESTTFKVEDGMYQASGYGSRGSTTSYRAKVSFDIPPGKKAIVSFDYDDESWGENVPLVQINGETYQNTDDRAKANHFTSSNLLPSGRNTIELVATVQGKNDLYGRLDHLSVVFLDEQQPKTAEQAAANVRATSSGWHHILGSFTTPYSAMAYRSQPILYQNGLEGPYTDYFYKKWIVPDRGAPYWDYEVEKQLTLKIPQNYMSIYTKVDASTNNAAVRGNATYLYPDNFDNMSTATASFSYRTSSSSNFNFMLPKNTTSGLITAARPSWDGSKWARLSNIEMAMIPLSEINALTQNNKYFIDKENQRIYLENDTFAKTGVVSLHFQNGANPQNQSSIQNLKVYTLENGVKSYVLDEYFGSAQSLDAWNTQGVAVSVAKDNPPKEEEDTKLVYKKGELVAYGITYSDYENDPSKNQFYKYTHMPFNDGPHPNAAVILDGESNIISSVDKIWNKAIERFYIDGKYMLSHYQIDKTGVESYDRFSNTENLTFYIEGSVEAPWITHINTVPKTVKEGDKYKLSIGVDDKEKEVLSLITELYREGRLIYTHKKTGITPGSNGVYPDTLTDDAPIATPGRYEVVATVRNLNGAGLGNCKFTVITEGKITGKVYHAPDWEKNRKKYNRSKSGSENSPRAANVFWSGEKFMLQGKTQGKPSSVKVEILGTNYSTWLKSADLTTWDGSLWDKSMINKWGRKKPETLTFRFTAYFKEGKTKTDEVRVIIDSKEDYWQLHRLF